MPRWARGQFTAEPDATDARFLALQARHDGLAIPVGAARSRREVARLEAFVATRAQSGRGRELRLAARCSCSEENEASLRDTIVARGRPMEANTAGVVQGLTVTSLVDTRQTDQRVRPQLLVLVRLLKIDSRSGDGDGTEIMGGGKGRGCKGRATSPGKDGRGCGSPRQHTCAKIMGALGSCKGRDRSPVTPRPTPSELHPPGSRHARRFALYGAPDCCYILACLPWGG